MKKIALMSVFIMVFSFFVISSTLAVTTCTFTTVGTIMTLDADCTTDETILVPDGFTLDGDGHTITAVDPSGGHFVGAVVKNGGSIAHVKNLGVTADSLSNVCDAGTDRLRGIMFEGASGSIKNNFVDNINQGASGCQEGNAIEVRNAPFDGTHPDTKTVKIANNKITNYQKTGIVANGDVYAEIKHNEVGSSATQANLAANSVQFGFGGTGILEDNEIDGNQWCGPSDFVATAVLLFSANNVKVGKNDIGGNSDLGIYAFGDGISIIKNEITDDSSIADCNAFGYDIGIGNYGTGNAIDKNEVCGFETSFDGPVGSKNEVCEADEDESEINDDGEKEHERPFENDDE